MPLATSIKEYQNYLKEIDNLKDLLNDDNLSIKEMAEIELKECSTKVKLLEILLTLSKLINLFFSVILFEVAA